MTITIAGIAFDYHDYDKRGDVLYLHVGKPKDPPARALETPEGHTVEYDEPLEPIKHVEPGLPATCRLGNGAVQRAIVKVLASTDGPMRLRDIHTAVEDALGQVVSKESVSWCLRMSRSGAGLRFERVAVGFYQLMSQT